MSIMWISAIGAIFQFVILIFSNLPKTERLRDSARNSRFLVLTACGLFACLVSIYGIYQSNNERKQDKADAERQVVAAKQREEEAKVRENEMHELLLSIGAGVGNQQAAMLAVCPPPNSIEDGAEAGSELTTYKILHYGNVDLWFHFPTGRFSHAEAGNQAISLRHALKLNGCLANVLHIPKLSPPPSPPAEDQATESSEKSHDSGGAIFVFFVIIFFLYWVFKKRE